MPEKLNENEKRRYVHYTLHPDDILFIADNAAALGLSQSQFVSAMVGFTRKLGPLVNQGITVKPA